MRANMLATVSWADFTSVMHTRIIAYTVKRPEARPVDIQLKNNVAERGNHLGVTPSWIVRIDYRAIPLSQSLG